MCCVLQFIIAISEGLLSLLLVIFSYDSFRLSLDIQGYVVIEHIHHGPFKHHIV